MKRQQFSHIPEIGLSFLSFFLNFSWEVVHTYFYTLKNSDFNIMLYGWLHCTWVDVMVTLGSFWLVSLTSWNRRWFLKLTRRNFIGFIIIGVVYTVLSEWANVQVFKSWGYNELMPVIPFIRAGVTPILQWMVIPSVTILLLKCHVSLAQEAAKKIDEMDETSQRICH